MTKSRSNFCFTDESSLWKKQKYFKNLKNKELTAKRYQFIKIGKILGLQTKRYVCQVEGCLFYFNDAKDRQYLGFCKLQNIYLQWLRVGQQRYLLILSNATQKSIFVFPSREFWNQQKEQITKYVVQVDFRDKFQVLGLLGEGSFSKVHKIRSSTTGQFFAAKFIGKFDKNQLPTKKMAVSERKILDQFKNEKTVAIFYQFYQNDESYVIVMEYIPGKDLMSYFSQRQLFRLPKLKRLFIDILSILKQCHSKNIIHRDIKPQNIILKPEDLQPKIIDFGLAIVTNLEMESQSYYKCGTLGYTAPQVLLSDSIHYKSYGYKCDIYSFGIIAHMFLMGYNPLLGNSAEQTIENSKQPLQLKENEIICKFGEPCLIFLKKLLASNYKNRYTAEQALNSPFLRRWNEQQRSCSTAESARSDDTCLSSDKKNLN